MLLSDLAGEEVNPRRRCRHETIKGTVSQAELGFLRYKIIGAPKQFKKWPRPFFRLRTNHTCH
jgi:hypothetical protein